jgi:hypothetical protein
MSQIIFVSALLFLLQACSTAGPFVTNVSSDGNNGLNIEKCHVHYNALGGTVSSSDCTTQNIKLRSN